MSEDLKNHLRLNMTTEPENQREEWGIRVSESCEGSLPMELGVLAPSQSWLDAVFHRVKVYVYVAKDANL